MEMALWLRGLLLGFSIAATVGPMCILCIQRTLRRGFRYGLISGLGIATADGLYGCVAALGLTVIANFLVRQQVWIHLCGGLFLLYLGGKTVLTPPAERATVARFTATTSVQAYLSTLLLTLTNPLTILSFVAIFAGLGAGGSRGGALSVVVGVFMGSASWWLLLTSTLTLLRSRFTARWLLWIQRISGCIILVFALLAVVTFRW